MKKILTFSLLFITSLCFSQQKEKLDTVKINLSSWQEKQLMDYQEQIKAIQEKQKTLLDFISDGNTQLVPIDFKPSANGKKAVLVFVKRKE
jgi:hypothetical protein